MSEQIVLVVKIFGCKEHADAFLTLGRISMARLSHYRNIEDDGRRDVDEGGVVLLEPSFWVNGMKLSGVKRLRFDDGYERLRYVFCMTHFRVDANPSAPNQMREQISVSLPSLERFGPYAAVIRDIPEFIDRVEKALPSQAVATEIGLVEYRSDSPSTQTMNLHLRDPVAAVKRAFRKDAFFELEREWRLVLCDGSGGKAERIEFDVGSLDDIATLMSTRDLSDLQFRYVEPE